MKTGRIQVVQRNQSRKLEWSLSADSATASYFDGGKLSGSLIGVDSVLYHKDKPASRVRSAEARADQRTGLLVFEGNVKVTAEERGLVLIADRVEWMATRKLIAATGRVRVLSPDYEASFQQVWATPDLKRVGSPDQFEVKP